MNVKMWGLLAELLTAGVVAAATVPNGGNAFRDSETVRTGSVRLLPSPVRVAPEYVAVFDVRTSGAEASGNVGVQGVTELEPGKPAPGNAPWTMGEMLEGRRRGTPAKLDRFGCGTNFKVPVDTQGAWTTLVVRCGFRNPTKLPTTANACFTLNVKSGSVETRRISLAPLPAEAVWRPARAEWLRVSFADRADERIPAFRTTDGERELVVENASGERLTGDLVVTIDTWRTPTQGRFGRWTKRLDGFTPGKRLTFDVDLGALPPDAYVATATLALSGETLVVASADPVDMTVFRRNARLPLREGENERCFAVFTGTPHGRIVGVGNGMIGRFFTPDDIDKAREIGLVSAAGPDYLAAAFGAPGLTADHIDQGRNYPTFSIFKDDPVVPESRRNPINDYMLDIFRPENIALIKERAERCGRYRASHPGVYALRLNNEKAYFNRNAHCPTAAADASFRAWCRRKYGSLENLNRAWCVGYASWDEVEQVISAKMVDFAKASYVEKKGAAAVDWKASSTFLSGKGYEEALRKNWAKTLDWFRWTTASTLWLNNELFFDVVRKYDKETLYGNCYVWPEYWAAVTMRHFRHTKNAQLDIQYCAGFDGGKVYPDRHLGNNDEMFDALELVESCVPGCPIIGNEIYIQPVYDPEYPAVQHWGLLAHGMSNILDFGWKMFSDHGYKTFYDPVKSNIVTKSWTNTNSVPTWMLIDVDGTVLPHFQHVKRSAREIAAFHRKYDFWKTHRVQTRVGWYLSDDTSELAVAASGNRCWGSPIITARSTLAASLRRAGVTMTYLNDDDVGRMKTDAFDTIRVPPAPILSDRAAEVLRDFAADGGTLIVLGPTGVWDENLHLRETPGGAAWKELTGEVKMPVRWAEPDRLLADMAAYPAAVGSAGIRVYDETEDAAKAKLMARQVMEMPETKVPGAAFGTIGSVRPCGKGRAIFCSVFPERRTQMPYYAPALRAYMEEFMRLTDLPRQGWFERNGKVPANNHEQLLGRGVPEVEVVVRDHEDGDRFVFALNCGGAGSGRLVLPFAAKSVEDVLTGKRVGFSVDAGRAAIPVAFGRWGYHVLKVR